MSGILPTNKEAAVLEKLDLLQKVTTDALQTYMDSDPNDVYGLINKELLNNNVTDIIIDRVRNNLQLKEGTGFSSDAGSWAKLNELAKEICFNNKADRLHFDTSAGLNLLNTLTPDSPKGDIYYAGNKIGEALISELSLYRNKLKPVLHSYIDKVKSSIGYKVSKADNYEIKEVAIPRIVEDADALGLFNDPLTNDAMLDKSLYPNTIPVFDIKDITLTETELNGYLNEMLTEEDKANPAKYFDIMNKLFELNPLSNVINLEDTVKAWLIAKFIKEQKLAEIGVSESKMLNLIGALATKVNIAIKTINDYVKLEKLFLSMDRCEVTGKLVVKVFKPVYDSCTNEIGLVDAILGMAVKDKVNYEDTFKASILAHKEELIKVWDAFLASSKYKNPVEEQNRLRLGFIISLRQVIDELDPELKTLHSGSQDFSSLDAAVEGLLKAGRLTDDDEFIEKMCVAIIGKYLFNKTNYFKFFQCVERFLDRDNSLNVDDVIPMVLTVFVVDYLMSKMKQM